MARLRLQSFLRGVELWELLGGLLWLRFGGLRRQIVTAGLQGLLGMLTWLRWWKLL